MNTNLEISTEELAELLKASDPPRLIDVREAWEHQKARIDGSELISLRTLPARVDEIEGERDVVVYCHSGMRSYLAAQMLQSRGIRARSLAGGIDAWSRLVDPSVPRY